MMWQFFSKLLLDVQTRTLSLRISPHSYPIKRVVSECLFGHYPKVVSTFDHCSVKSKVPLVASAFPLFCEPWKTSVQFHQHVLMAPSYTHYDVLPFYSGICLKLHMHNKEFRFHYNCSVIMWRIWSPPSLKDKGANLKPPDLELRKQCSCI